MRLQGNSFCLACFALAMFVLPSTQSGEAIIKFSSRTVSSPALSVSECWAARPHYELHARQPLVLLLTSDVPLTDDYDHRCRMLRVDGEAFTSDTIYEYPPIISREELNSTLHISKVVLGSVGDAGYLRCYFIFNSTSTKASDPQQHYTTCFTYIRLLEASSNEPVTQYASYSKTITFNAFANDIEEIQYNETTSISVYFVMPDREDCSYTVVTTGNYLRNMLNVNLPKQQDCSYKLLLRVTNRKKKLVGCYNNISKKTGLFFAKMSVLDDTREIGLVEKNNHTNATRKTAIKLVYIDNATTDFENAIVRFTVRTKVSQSMVMSECVSKKDHYVVYRRQNITVEVVSDTFIVTDLGNCHVVNIDETKQIQIQEYNKRIQNKIKYGNNSISNKIFLSNIGAYPGYIYCNLLFNEDRVDVDFNNDTEKLKFSDHIKCAARLIIPDGVPDSFLLPYISTKIEVRFKEFRNETEALDVYENGSVNLDFTKFRRRMDCVYTVVRRDDTGRLVNPIIKQQSSYYLEFLNSNVDNNEISLEERNVHTHRTRRGAFKLNYRGVYNYTAIDETSIVAREDAPSAEWVAPLGGAALVVLVALAVGGALCWWRAVKQSRGAGGPACAPAAGARAPTPSPDEDSEKYENVYDVVYEDRLKQERVRSIRRREAKSPAPPPPPPPPLETMPRLPRLKVRSPRPTPLRQSLRLTHTLIAESDLYLLNIDSEGYEIPVIK